VNGYKSLVKESLKPVRNVPEMLAPTEETEAPSAVATSEAVIDSAVPLPEAISSVTEAEPAKSSDEL
jgi:hypothetical protein